MGGLLGAHLARAGESVTLIDVNPAAIDRINAAGVTIEEKDGTTETVAVSATSEPSSVGPVDLILNFVKCYHTEAAVHSALPMMGRETAVLTLQNGWGNADRIASVAGRDRVFVGLTYHSATLLAPGRIRHSGSGMTYMGELDAVSSPRLAAAGSAFRSAGLEVTESPRIIDEVWKKLALNVCTLPTGALLGFTADELNRHEGMRALMHGLLGEVGAVAAAEGIAFDISERWAAITALLDRAIGAHGSMLQDVQAKRATEIDVINGAIVAAGRRLGVSTPLNEAMVWMIESRQTHDLGELG